MCAGRPGVLLGTRIRVRLDLRRDWDHKIYWAKGGGGQSGRTGLAWRILSCEKTRHVWGVVGCLPGGAFCMMTWDGTGFFSKRSKTLRGIGAENGDGEFARVRLAFADAHFKCISVRISTGRAVSRSDAPLREKGFGDDQGGAGDKASGHMTTNCRP